MKNNTLILILLLFSTSLILAQDVNYEWAKLMWGGSVTPTNSISDTNGNLYTAGSFKGGYNFNSIPTATTYDLEADCVYNGYEYICYTNSFVQKVDTNGNLVWLKQIGANNTVAAKRITKDNNGNIFILGSFSGDVDFDPSSGSSNLNVNVGAYFILKLNMDGDFQWVKQLTVSEAMAIATDSNGNVYTTGSFHGTIDFDPNEGVANLTSNTPNAQKTDVFIQKLDANGDFVWVKQIGGPDSEYAYSIQIDSDGSLYTTGYFPYGTVDFDPGAGVFNMTAINRRFVLKLDSDGNFLWAIQSPASDISACTLDSNKNIYLTGYFQGTVDFDPSNSVNSLTSTGNNDIYIEKLNTNGEFQWVKQIVGTTDNDRSMAITTDNMGAVYTTGQFYGTVNFNPSNNSTTTSLGDYDAFIQKLDTNGGFQWVKIIAGTGSETINSVTTDSNANIYTTGTYYGATDFDPNAGIVNLANSNSNNFIQKLSPTSLIMNDVSKNDIKIYPNPSNGTFYLDLENYIADEVLIYDSLGNQIIKETNIGSKKITLNGTTGLYFIKIRVKNNIQVNKIIVE